MTRTSNTAFRAWREKMGYTKQKAAERLGLTPNWIRALDYGVEKSSGKAVLPDLRTRLAMAALARRLGPWPVDPPG